MARRGKRQTQLAFTPLPTSSSQSPEVSENTQSRLARIRYRDGLVKDLSFSSSDLKLEQTPVIARTMTSEPDRLPTPLASSQLDGAGGALDSEHHKQMSFIPLTVRASIDTSGEEISSSDSSAIGMSQVNQRLVKQTPRRNATSFFSPSTSPHKKVPLLQQSPSRPRVSSSTSLFRNSGRELDKQEQEQFRPASVKNAISQVLELSDRDSDIVVTPNLMRKHRKYIRKLSVQTVGKDTDDGVTSPSRQIQLNSDKDNYVSNNHEDSEDNLVSRQPLRKVNSVINTDGQIWSQQGPVSEQMLKTNDRILRSSTNKGDFLSQIIPVTEPKATPRQHRHTSHAIRTSSPTELLSDLGTEDSGEDFDPLHVGAKRSLKKKSSKVNTTNFIISSGDDNAAEDPDSIGRPIRTQITGAAQKASESDSDVIVSPSKRRRLLDSRDISPRSSKKKLQEKEDLEEDLNFLKPSDSEDQQPLVPKKPSERETRKLSLEKMKARREKKTAMASPSVEPQDEDYNDSEESDVIQDYQLGDQNLDEYDEDFVIEGCDDEDANMADIPIQFTQHAHASVKVHFKYVIEWMVHNKINPAFSRNDPLYRMAFEKVDYEAKGYSNSKLMSSTWGPEFNRALRARPIFSETELSSRTEVHCAACNRTSHPASFVVTLSGNPYHPDTLENLRENDEDSDGNSSSSTSDVDSIDVNGHVLPSMEYEFYLGSFCKANSARAHALLHWKWHLNDWVIDWLAQKGYTNAEYIVERDKWSHKKRQKFANKVVDEIEDEETKNLWRDFKNQLSEAREQKTYYTR